ncbi:MAG: hypothetical protein WD180_05580, partial [Pseudohongiellaceae bacterium]
MRAITICLTAYFGLSLLLVVAPVAYAQNSEFRIPRVDTAPRIDGLLSDEGWSPATSVAVNVATRPGE